jgi:Na+/proline symporter
LQKLIAIISLIFLLTYASAQLLAGSKALHVLLDWPTWAGAVGGAIMVALYCVAGGIRASIWTDAAQSVVMITAMAILLGVGIYSLGGFGDTFTQLNAIPNYMNLTANADAPISGLILFLIGWMVAGFSVAGQPHIMVRFMTLNNNQSIGRAKIWYYAWFVAFYCMATGVGFLARIYLADTTTFDVELALPTIAQHLLPPALTGLILAGIFAATMSTADSLLLSCSSALSHDLFPKHITQTWLLRVCTFVLTLIALGIALTAHSNVFNLVIMAWSGLGSAFIPLLIILCAGAKPSQFISITMLLVGLSVAVVWRYAGLNSIVYEGLPGIAAGLGVWGGAWVMAKTIRTAHH